MNNLSLARVCLSSIAFIGAWLLMIRLIRQRFPFPVPHFMIHVIDNPLRRAIQPLHKKPERLGVRPGMTVLEIGPGSGTYTLAVAGVVGEAGKVVALDIGKRVVEHVRRRVVELGVGNVEVCQGDAQALEFAPESFDAIFAITVYGEIPDRVQALAEFHRVLKAGGSLAISEFLLDPDSQPKERVRSECEAAGFIYGSQSGNLLHYTLCFTKPRT